MFFPKKIIFWPMLLLLYPAYADPVPYPFYFGLIAGYGSTTWKGLVPKDSNQSLALNMSTPIEVDEGGSVIGVMSGFEISSNAAIEVKYTRFQDAIVTFDHLSLFSFSHDNALQFVTKTETIQVIGKLLVAFPDERFRVFSGAGIAEVHRKDELINNWRLSPSFDLGLNYRFSERFMAEIAGNYTAGYGESQLNPAEAYYPFLFSVALHLLYCFG